MSLTSIRVIALAIATAAIAYGNLPAERPAILGGRSLLHAHNAYPEEGRWRDRIDRALATNLLPVVIEQDLAYAPSRPEPDRVVVSHDTTLDGTEPTLSAHFFERVRPIVERALAAGQRERWPLIVLHLDFKTNETAHHRAVWDLLRRHEAWLTTAAADPDPMRVTALTPGPLMVLTENGTDQEKDFSAWAAETKSHLIFGSIPGPAIRSSDDPVERARLFFEAAPNALVPTAATSYRRWVNFAWMVVEEGGPPKAAAWTDRDDARLRNIVDYAHRQGLLVRFYTLNGHDAIQNRGWSAGYNFGSLTNVRPRWRAAINAGVDLIATDQYEELAAVINAQK
jgi:hypothetical protein